MSQPPTDIRPGGTLFRPRRDFLSTAAWLVFWTIAGGFGFMLVKFLSPRRRPLSRSEFIAGKPADYVTGEVSERWLREHQTWIIRDYQRIYAVWARCTHMHCSVQWDRNQSAFNCPCHRSRFDVLGNVSSGLATRPLERFRVYLNDRGELVVDKAVVFSRSEQWSRPGASVNV